MTRTCSGLVTFYVLFFLRIETREIHIAGMTPHPNEAWMTQVARNVSMADTGFLHPGDYLIHDRDGKYCPVFLRTLEDVGVKPLALPPRSPNLNAHAERWVLSAKSECLAISFSFQFLPPGGGMNILATRRGRSYSRGRTRSRAAGSTTRSATSARRITRLMTMPK